MSELTHILAHIRSLENCTVEVPGRVPDLPSPHALPPDALDFYTASGGVTLFSGSPYGIRIVSPGEVVQANLAIAGGDKGYDDLLLVFSPDHPSWSWYVIAQSLNLGEYIVMDLSEKKRGQCYEAFWDSYAHPKYTPIIARSFTELLTLLIAGQGQNWYWLEPDFKSWGSGYD